MLRGHVAVLAAPFAVGLPAGPCGSSTHVIKGGKDDQRFLNAFLFTPASSARILCL
jgi:hypothetical protein